MRTASNDVIRLGSPGDLVGAVPHLLGFVPAESLVVVCLHGPRRRVGLTMRFDLPASRDERAFAMEVSHRAEREQATALFIVLFTAAAGRAGGLPRRRLMDQLAAAIEAPVVDVVLTRDGRWWSYLCDDADCCPPVGRPLDPQAPAVIAFAAANALRGQAVLPDREAVVASVAPIAGPPAAAMQQACRRAATSLEGVPLRLRIRRARRLVDGLVTRYADPPASVTDSEAARLAALLGDVLVRDDLLASGADGQRAEQLRVIAADVARRIPPPHDAPICAVLGWFAYAAGDGVTAAAALERALATDVDYSLARLLADALRRQAPPSVLIDAMRATGGTLPELRRAN
jgi:hypothetical protein